MLVSGILFLHWHSTFTDILTLHKKCPNTGFFQVVFSCLRLEYRKIRIRKNTIFWTLFTQCYGLKRKYYQRNRNLTPNVSPGLFYVMTTLLFFSIENMLSNAVKILKALFAFWNIESWNWVTQNNVRLWVTNSTKICKSNFFELLTRLCKTSNSTFIF